MAFLSMQGVTLNLGAKPLLDAADLSVETGERICLVGRNGAGKSSLLALLGGQMAPDSGLILRPGTPMGQMPQDVPEDWRGSVFSLVAAALGEEGKALAAAHAGTAQGQAVEADAWEHYGEVLAVINRLGLNPDADFTALSGGTKRRVALARALVCSEDLILDEPTNHLDLTTITWLEDFLLRKVRTLIFVSHDRAFAGRLATRVVEIDRGRLFSYSCGFDRYPERREERLAAEERACALFDKKLAQEETWIRQGIKARRTRNMGRVRALESLRSQRAARRARQGNVRMAAQEAERSGKLVMAAENVAFAYPGKPPLFSNFSAVIQRGDRVGLIGDNGAGKTKQLIELVHASVAEEGGCVVCIEPGADMTYDIKSSVRLVNAGEYHLDSFECLRGFISGLYAGNYDISHVYVDNLCKIVHSEDFAAVEKFLHWLDKFSDANTVKFTVTLTADASVATEGMRKYL